jgi:16S rRNA (adenine1518-N6/adenine1519-N6)-dimethyltransferase
VREIFEKKQTNSCLEIGSGQGALTKVLLHEGLDVHGLEVDSRLEPDLNLLKSFWKGKFSYEFQNVLSWIPSFSIDEPKKACVGHIPYHLSSSILIWFLEHCEQFSFGLFLVQKEFAERLASDFNSKSYGRLSIISQLKCRVHLLKTVPPSAFSPPPEVHSAYVFLEPFDLNENNFSWDKFGRFTKALFLKRRKKLKNICKVYGLHEDDWKELSLFSIDSEKRPENLSPEQIKNLFLYVRKKKIISDSKKD